mgnify:CR=1 FL=1
MAITVGGTSITFSDATTQTSAGITSAVTSAVGGNGISVSAATGAVTFTLGATAQNAVGSVVWAASTTYLITGAASNIAAGTTVAGSTLSYNSVAGNASNEPIHSYPDYASLGLTGTWRCQQPFGRSYNCCFATCQNTIWIRIS